MPNIPKPDLERGNFICYADEPNTIVDNAGGGGGGGGGDAYDVSFIATLISGTLADYATIPFLQSMEKRLQGLKI